MKLDPPVDSLFKCDIHDATNLKVSKTRDGHIMLSMYKEVDEFNSILLCYTFDTPQEMQVIIDALEASQYKVQ